MLTDVPTANGLEDAGLGYLNLAWDDVMSMLSAAAKWEEYKAYAEQGHDPVENHWAREQRRLAICAALVHQGAEFLVKARIAGVSPYLLLDSPSTWPGEAAKRDLPFGDLRTVDAQQLVRLHDSVSTPRLSEHFKQQFESLRRRRNKLVHGLPAVALDAITIAKEVLDICTEMKGEGTWPKIRRDFALGDPNAGWDHHGQIRAGLIFEFDTIIASLTPSECKRHLAFSKKQRRYECPTCRSDDVFPEVALAIRVPKDGPDLYCIACGAVNDVSNIQSE